MSPDMGTGLIIGFICALFVFVVGLMIYNYGRAKNKEDRRQRDRRLNG